MTYSPKYNSESPYHFTSITGKYMTYYVHRSVFPHPFDKVTILNNERYVARPDLLAMDLYGNEDLFWVIPLRNGLQDPVFDLTIGRALIIPDSSYVSTLI